MEDFDAIARIKELCDIKGWSVYRLSKASGIPYSTLNTMLRKTSAPTIPSLIKICNGLGIPVSQFFEPDDETVYLSTEEADWLRQLNGLNDNNRASVLSFLKWLVEQQERQMP